MNEQEKIKMLEREIELLKQIIELKDKINTKTPTIVQYPIYPSYPYPNNPYTYPIITYDTTIDTR